MAKIRLHQSIIYHGKLYSAGSAVEIDNADADMLKNFGEIYDLPEVEPEPPQPAVKNTRSRKAK